MGKEKYTGLLTCITHTSNAFTSNKHSIPCHQNNSLLQRLNKQLKKVNYFLLKASPEIKYSFNVQSIDCPHKSINTCRKLITLPPFNSKDCDTNFDKKTKKDLRRCWLNGDSKSNTAILSATIKNCTEQISDTLIGDDFKWHPVTINDNKSFLGR